MFYEIVSQNGAEIPCSFADDINCVLSDIYRKTMEPAHSFRFGEYETAIVLFHNDFPLAVSSPTSGWVISTSCWL